MIRTKNYIAGSEWWVNSEALSFSQIVRQSKMPDHWARYDSGCMNGIKSILNPINRYAFSLYPRPQVVSIVNNLVTFRQRTHAEIWVQDKGNDSLYALDKCHQRQFYPSANSFESNECFKPTYRFYIPWFINKNIQVSIKKIQDEETPFYINEKTFNSQVVDLQTPYADTEFVDFKIKNTGKHSLKDGYAIISKSTAMYDMSVLLTDKEIIDLKEDYAK
jgi:hypothetical protein